MSTLNKFVIYKCDTCNRKTEILIDGNRPDPVRCNITYKCRGKLQRIGESSTKKFLFTPPIAGLQDYIPRGTSLPSSVLSEDDELISLFTGGGSGMLTMALPTKSTALDHTFEVLDSSGNVFALDDTPELTSVSPKVSANMILYKISPDLLQFKRYSYIVSGVVQVVRGIDDSPNANSLKFSSSNRVRVFINGVELDASNFDRSVDDLITFTPAIYESNNVVDVIVYNNISSSSGLESIKLQFRPLSTTVSAELALLCANAWGDSKGVTIDGTDRYLMHCSDLSELSTDFSYGVSAVEVTTATETRVVSPSEVALLFGISPFLTQDKDLYSYLGGPSLIDSSNVLSYGQNQNSGITELSVKDSILTHLARPLAPFGITKIGSVSSGTVVSQQTKKHQYILGPT